MGSAQFRGHNLTGRSWSWSLAASNNRLLAVASSPCTEPACLLAQIEEFRRQAEEESFEIVMGDSNAWLWRTVGEPDVARCPRPFARRVDAEKAVRAVRRAVLIADLRLPAAARFTRPGRARGAEGPTVSRCR